MPLPAQAGLQITAGTTAPTARMTVDSIKYTVSAGSPTYVPIEHRQAVIDGLAAKGITVSGVTL